MLMNELSPVTHMKMGEGGTGGASDITNAGSSKKDSRATGGLDSTSVSSKGCSA